MGSSTWTKVGGDGKTDNRIPAGVFDAADRFYDELEAGTIDLSDALPVDEFIAQAFGR